MDTFVITRAYMENPYIECFIEHYISLNFKKIILLKSDNHNYIINEKYKNNVIIHNVQNTGNCIYTKNKSLFNKLNGWYLFVDLDEFLILHNKWNSNIVTFLEYVQKKNKNVNTIMFRWAMIEKYNNNTSDLSIKNVIHDYNKYHNKHIKSMVKSSCFINMTHPHYPDINTTPCVYIDDKIINNLNPRQDILNKSYHNSYLIHIHTRSIKNIICKSLNNYHNMCSKSIACKNIFINYINNKLYLKSNNLLDDFTKYIGVKAKLPFGHANNKTINTLPDLKYDCNILNTEIENDLLRFYCNKFSINYDNINEFMELLNNLDILKKFEKENT